MKTRIAFATLITLTLCFASGRAQTLDTGKLDRFLDRLAEKNKGMGSVTFAVSTEVLDRYVGTYSTPDAPLKWTITRRGNVLYFQPPGNSAVPLEATAENKFTIAPGVFFEFDAAKGTLTIKRPQGERVFTKDK